MPLVIGYNLISAFTGIKAIAHSLTVFIALRIGVNLGAGAGAVSYTHLDVYKRQLLRGNTWVKQEKRKK